MSQSVSKPILEVEGLCKYFRISKRETLKAVDGVSFQVSQGETIGLVGESGCGKSTLGRTIVRLYKPTAGTVRFEGQDVFAGKGTEAKDYTKNMQMIFQNPYSSLNPRMTVKEIVAEGMGVHGIYTKGDQETRVMELLEMVGLGRDHLSRFPHEFSGGQRQRIGIARALSVDPKFVVCDEPISALDVSVQAQVINMMKTLQQKLGLTYLFIAHDLSVVKYLSDRVIVMYLGSVVEQTTSEELYANPLHPYTQALLSAIPVANPKVAKASERIVIKGEVPSPINPKECCRFVERCGRAEARCHAERPAMRELSPGHFAACHLI